MKKLIPSWVSSNDYSNMDTKPHGINTYLPKFLIFTLSLFLSIGLNAQISVIESLDNGVPTGWTQSGYSSGEGGNAGGATACEGSEDLSDNLWSSSTTGFLQTVSQTSNGDEITISFQWQTVEYNTGDGVGLSADVEYSTDGGSTYTNIGSYTATAVTPCTVFSTTIAAGTVPNGTSFVLRVTGNHTAGDFYHVLDNFSITQPVSNPPNCDAALTSATTDFPLDGTVTWSAATGAPTGYKISIGSSMGGTDIANNVDVGNSTSYTPQGLQYSTTYYVTITPYNAVGDATGCTEASFTTLNPPPTGSLCTDPIVIASAPYNTTDNTSNYGDDYSNADNPCTTVTASYMNGDDVVYSYTPSMDESINIVLTGTGTYTGIMVFTDCPFTNCVGNAGSSSNTNPKIENLSVTAGTTYYIVISTWPSPQNTAYTLDLTVNSCTVATVSAPTADFTNCPNSTSVSFEVTDMGTATSLAVTNDQGGSNPANITAVGTYTITGLPTTGEAVITLTDAGDPSCVVTLNAVSLACPPANDDCSGAIALTVNADENCGATTSGTLVSATASAEDATACSGTENDDVWFSFVATNTSHLVSLTNVMSTPTDLYHSLWEGSCGSLTQIGTCSDSDNSTQTGLVIGNTYYLRVNSWSGNSGATTTFDVCIGTPPAPPANDECSGAVDITGSINMAAAVIGNNNNATDGTNPFTATGGNTFYSWGNANPAYKDVWYKVDVSGLAGCFGFLSVSTLGTTFDTKIAIYEGSCSAAALSGNDDFHGSANDWTSLTTAAVQNNTTYYIQVANYGSTTPTGNITMEIKLVDITGSVPHGAGDVTADFECRASDGWTHYVNSVSGQLLLSIEKGTENVGWVPMTATSCTVSAGSGALDLGTADPACQAFYTNTDHWVVMNRTWDFSPSTQPGSAVNIRSYFTPNDVNDLNTGLTAAGLPAISAIGDIVHYKINNGEENLTTNNCHSDNNGGNASYQQFVSSPTGSCAADHYAQYAVSSFSGGGGGSGTGGASGALPVTLDKFTAKEDGRYNKIEWSTVSEINADHHTVLKAVDGINFTPLTQVDAAIDGAQYNTYEVLDQYPGAVTYYKLMMTDLDGSVEYSPIVSVTRNNDSKSTFFGASPVPTNDNVSLNIYSQDDDRATITVFDISGKVMHTMVQEIGKGNHQINLNLEDYTSGMYMVTIKSNYLNETTRVIRQ